MNNTKANPFLILLIILSVYASSCWSRKNLVSVQPKGYIYVPTGVVTLNSGQRITMHAFWMSETEITNKQYHEYLKSTTNKDSFTWAYPDTALINNELFVGRYTSYFENPLFEDFPVVGLNKEQMQGFARWFSKTMNDKYPHLYYRFRLPSKAEWYYAAHGGRSYANHYPWGGDKAHNSKGCYLLHHFTDDLSYKIYKDSSIHYLNKIEDLTDSLIDNYLSINFFETKKGKKVLKKKFRKKKSLSAMPVYADSYFPNDYGLYQMSGNVAEMLSDGIVVGGSFRTSEEYCKIRNEKPYPFDASRPQVDIGFRIVATYNPRYDLKQ